MRKKANNSMLSMILLTTLVITGCYGSIGAYSVRRKMIDVGQARVVNTGMAQFSFRNNRKELLVISFLPECDCTTVSAESITVEPHRRGSINVKVAVETKGEFTKYVYVQAAGGDEFFTVSIKGRGK